ncbi:MAG: IS1634 family transposase [Nanoarchaeota archaeon]|nr:IS1634 family transposase [Nanoarchaeota archaeon]MBU4086712.1 IS1634 family transposase [Nanoarchaeota archaeon]
MSFVRKIKRGKCIYLAEVENKWIGGKVIQKHIRYVGKELNGERILSGSIKNSEVTKVSIWAPLIALNTLAKEINLLTTLGDYGKYLMSLAYAHCLEPKSINKMEDWFARTDLHKILSIEDVSEKKLYNALDSITDEKSEHIQKRIFNSVKETYQLKSTAHFFDVTNVYFYGTECGLAKKGHNKEGSYNPQVQIGLAVEGDYGIPIFHKTFEGNIFDARILKDMLTSFHNFDFQDVFIVWDRGNTSENNILDAKNAGFEVICGLPIKQKVKKKVDETIRKKKFVDLKNRVRLKNTVLYCIMQRYGYGKVKGNIVICFNEETTRINREKRIDNIYKAKDIIENGKPLPDSMKRYFKGNSIDEKAIKEAQKYDGYSVLFSTKKLSIEQIVKPYFEKDKVEKAFRSLKSVLGLRPIRHWLEERVKAHIFICYLSYLLLSMLEFKLKNSGIGAIEALDKLSTAYKVYLKDKKTKNEFEKIVMLTKEQETIMKAIDKNILKPSV